MPSCTSTRIALFPLSSGIANGVVLSVFVVLTGRESEASPLRNWTHEELRRESDLMVIARFKTWDIVDWHFDDEPWRTLFAQDTDGVLRKHIVARRALFTVETTLRGEFSGSELPVLLYGYRENNPGLENGPRFFPTQLAQEKDGPAMLLYLRRGPPGYWVPATGQGHAVDSVYALMPSPDWVSYQAWDRLRKHETNANDAGGLDEFRKRLEVLRSLK